MPAIGWRQMALYISCVVGHSEFASAWGLVMGRLSNEDIHHPDVFNKYDFDLLALC